MKVGFVFVKVRIKRDLDYCGSTVILHILPIPVMLTKCEIVF